MTADATNALIDRYMAVQRAFGRPEDCEACLWIQAQKDRADTDQVLAEMLARPDWQARFSYDALVSQLDREGGDDRAVFQVAYARDLTTKGPFGKWRGQVEALIRTKGAAVEPEVWPVLIAWFAANTLNPKAFFAREDVLPNMPSSIDLTDLAAPSFPDLAAQALTGGRAVP